MGGRGGRGGVDQQLQILLFSLEYWVPATYSSIRNDYCRLANLTKIALSNIAQCELAHSRQLTFES